MRSVSFVNHLKLSTGGKVSQQCMALGDVDGDGQNELVVAVEGIHSTLHNNLST